jgi:hypothetical protein
MEAQLYLISVPEKHWMGVDVSSTPRWCCHHDIFVNCIKKTLGRHSNYSIFVFVDVHEKDISCREGLIEYNFGTLPGTLLPGCPITGRQVCAEIGMGATSQTTRGLESVDEIEHRVLEVEVPTTNQD